MQEILQDLLLFSIATATWFLVIIAARHLSKTTPPAPQAVPNPPAQEHKSTPKELPGKSCGHCGTRIKSEPVRGMSIEQASYVVFKCPVCKKETLLPYTGG